MTFAEWYDEYCGDDLGPPWHQDDMEAAFQAGYDAATNYYAKGGSFK
jgi:hypothetical protein